ncbi:hypothetical protein [Caldalkalibacillus salinus]|uniref:hypothetical protein n=1 Tax=Caldalkalibacillus salinus TaxID=2803787 RepID=UPI001922CA2D|nr:hypothetical protein [Caldalkalibacillus salinus]
MLTKALVSILIFTTMLAGAWHAHDYVEQQHAPYMKQDRSVEPLSNTLEDSDRSFERLGEPFKPREYIRITPNHNMN